MRPLVTLPACWTSIGLMSIGLMSIACRDKAVFAPTGCTVEGGDGLSCNFPRPSGGEAAATVTLQARAIGEGDLTVQLALTSEINSPTPVVAVTVSSEGGGTLEGVILEGDWSANGEGGVRLWRQGYQSWAWSGVTEPGDLARDDRGVPVVGGDEDGFASILETAGSSWWGGYVGHVDGGGLVVGALAPGDLKFFIAADDDELAAVWGTRGESVEIEAGGSLDLSPLTLSAPAAPEEVRPALIAWAQKVGNEGREPRLAYYSPPVGWNDWYQYYGAISSAVLLTELDGAGQHLELDVFQIDDGWEVAWGDWTANDRFPEGMAAMATAIDDEGMIPGLWMAPLLADPEAAVVTEHPDWFVQQAGGGPLLDGSRYVLDVTHPDAADWMVGQVRAMKEAGFTYFKFDFLYAGAMEGLRQEPLTGLQAYDRATALLREAVGDEAFILACGAPMLPSLGFADGWRSGADIAFVALPDPDPAFLRWQARATAGRSFVNDLWWWNDPDPVLLRPPATDGLGRAAIAANLVAGGVWFLGDSFALASEERVNLALDARLLAYQGVAFEPQAPLDFVSGIDGSPVFELSQGDDTVPTRWEADGAVVFLNLSDSPIEVVPPAGEEVLQGADPAPHSLAPNDAEVWIEG